MKSRKKPLKALFIFALILALFSAVYVHIGILPGKARIYVIDKIDQTAHKKVWFSKALWLPFHGFIFYDLEVREKDGSPLFKARRFGLDVKILPFFREKKIILNNVLLDSPVYDLILEKPKIVLSKPPIKTEISGEINVPVIDEHKKIELEDIVGRPDIFLPENVYIEQITITGGYLTIRQKPAATLIESVRDINVRMAFQKPPVLRFDGSLRIGEKPYASVDLTGTWNLAQASYQFNLMTDWDRVPAWLKNYQKNNFIILREGRAKLATRLRSVGEDKALFDAEADLRDAQISVRQTDYRGSVRIGAKGLFNFNTKLVERYKGNLDLVDVDILRLSPKIAEVSHVEGRIDFQPDLLTVQSIRGKYKDVPFDGRGTVTSFRNLVVDGRIYASVNLERILGLIPPEQKKLLKDFDIKGDCEALTTVRGSLTKFTELSSEYKMVLRNAVMTSRDKKIRLDNLSCELFSGKWGLKVTNARFDFGQKNYGLELFIPKKSDAAGEINLSSGGLSLKGNYQVIGDKIAIQNAQASLSGATARFSGWLYPAERSLMDIRGRVELDLFQLSKSFGSREPWIRDAGLRGTMRGNFSFKGRWDEFMRADVSLNAQGSPIFAKQSIRLENAVLDAALKNQILSVAHFAAGAYHGGLGLKGSFDLKKPGTAFAANIYLNNIDLRSLAEDLAPDNKKLSGILALQMNLQGRLKSPETYTGHGAMSVKNGYLWETSQFKAMGDLPLVRVEGLDVVTFHEMSAAFLVHDKRFWSDHLALLSDTVHLDLHGSLTFDQELDMLMDIEYTNAVFLGADDAGGLAPMMVNQAQNLISQYKVAGSLKNPRYEKIGAPENAANKLGNFLRGLTTR